MFSQCQERFACSPAHIITVRIQEDGEGTVFTGVFVFTLGGGLPH